MGDYNELLKQFAHEPERKKAPLCGLEPIPAAEMPCQDSQHYPPNYIEIPNGFQYRHKCPSCGAETVLRNAQVTL